MTVDAPYLRPFNHCNLPPRALGSLAFQLAPTSVEIDGLIPLHRPLFDHLDDLNEVSVRAQVFQEYMNAHFLLDDPGALGLGPEVRLDRSRLDYLKLLRGWLFDSQSREAAVMKGWVESRFGLLTRYHHGHVGSEAAEEREAFDHELALGSYATGALEAQIDLLYAFSQYELSRRLPDKAHLVLYRGTHKRERSAVLAQLQGGLEVLTLNNLTSFSTSEERAGEFGDHIMRCEVPVPKILAFTRLLPGSLQGEDEYLVIGGVVAVSWVA